MKIQCSPDSPSPDFSRFCFLSDDPLWSRSFLRYVRNLTEMDISVCTLVFQTLLYFFQPNISVLLRIVPLYKYIFYRALTMNAPIIILWIFNSYL